VKAVDAAANEGEWSQAQSFHAGWLPRWAMFAITVAIVLLVIIIGFAIRRRMSSYYD
jgi:cell division protein FtsX